MGYATTWVADYAVMTIVVDGATTEEEAEEMSLEILEGYTNPDLFHLDEIEEMR